MSAPHAISTDNWAAAAAGDEDARGRIIEAHTKLVLRVAHQLTKKVGADLDFNELASAGYLGLIQAYEGFDPARGLAFSTFAVPRIRGAMLDELRRMDSASRVVRQKARQLAAATEALGHRLGRAPSEAEIATVLDLEPIDISRLRQAVESATLIRLDEPSGEGRNDAPLAHAIPTPDAEEDALLGAEERDVVHERLSDLPEIERTILGLWLYEDLRFADIAELLGRAESRIGQLRKEAMDKVRASLEGVVWNVG